MKKTILITGSTDGIGLETAKMLASQGHHVMLHGRNAAKLEDAEEVVSSLSSEPVVSYLADLSRLSDVEAFASVVTEQHARLDVLINNAGILKTAEPVTLDGLDVRFIVNTIAPYRLTKLLLPLMSPSSRIINLSSAAQSPVDTEALAGHVRIADDMTAYAQSKLAITMWSRSMAVSLKDKGPVIVAVNPGSLLGTKMVKEGFGMAGHDIQIGADILCRAALSDEFASATGQYFDNDSHQFAAPHSDALNPEKCEQVVQAIETILSSVQ